MSYEYNQYFKELQMNFLFHFLISMRIAFNIFNSLDGFHQLKFSFLVLIDICHNANVKSQL